jgi:hypothetical protein
MDTAVCIFNLLFAAKPYSDESEYQIVDGEEDLEILALGENREIPRPLACTTIIEFPVVKLFNATAENNIGDSLSAMIVLVVEI